MLVCFLNEEASDEEEDEDIDNDVDDDDLESDDQVMMTIQFYALMTNKIIRFTHKK